MDENNKAPKRELTRLEKRYKRLRWAQHILFWLSIIAAVAPVTITALEVGLIYKTDGSGEGFALAGYAIFVIAIGALLMVKGLRDKFRDKLPWSTTAAIGAWIMTGFIGAIRTIVNDTYFISLALAIGCTVAAITSTISDYCKSQADILQDEYNRRQG